MSEFSTVLSHHIHSKEISVRSLADSCGIERTTMYKLINGKRKLQNVSVLKKMAAYMQLTPQEYDELQTAYKITAIGRSVYYKRLAVLDFLLNAEKSQSCGSANPDYTTAGNILAENDAMELNYLPKQSSLSQAICSAVHDECSLYIGNISILVQPDYTYLFDLLFSAVQNDRQLYIRHIVCLDNSEAQATDGSPYNLKCLRDMIPLLSNCPSYTARYYYGDIRLRYDGFSGYPFYLLTSSRLILFTYDYQSGVEIRRKDFVSSIRESFDSLYATSNPLFYPISSLFTQWDQWTRFRYEQVCVNELSYGPCIVPFINQHLIEKYADPALMKDKKLLAKVYALLKDEQRILQNGIYHCAITKNGLCNFLQTGCIDDIPKNIYRPLDREDRIYIVEMLCKMAESGSHRILKKELERLPYGLHLVISTDYGYLDLAKDTPQLFLLEEQSLLHTFSDFINVLEENEYLASPEESVAVIQQVLADYKSHYK